MSELIIANKADLVAVADAIRSKTGKTDEMYVSQMATEIDGITTDVPETEYEDGNEVLY